jgi:hypothetical protein
VAQQDEIIASLKSAGDVEELQAKILLLETKLGEAIAQE